MADYTPVAAQGKLPPQMSLGEMVNMANAVQGYQQAQQMNPLQLQRAQAELSRLQQLTPEEITRARAEAGRATTEANVSEKTAPFRISQAGSQADTAAAEALKAKYGLNANYQDDFTKILGGYANDPRLSPEALTKNKTNAVDVLHDIKAQAIARGIPSQSLDMITAPAMTIAMQKPESFPDHLKNMINTGLSASEKRASQLETTELTPSGQVIRKTPAGLYGQPQQIKIEAPGGNAPMPQIVEVNGVKYSVSPPTTPGGQPVYTPVGQTAPAAAPAAAPSATTAPKAQPTKAIPETSQREPIPAPQGTQRMPLVKQDMPVQSAPGVIPQMNEQQKARYDAGQTLFSKAADAATTASDQKLILDKIRQNLSQAQSSKPGQLLRKGGSWVAGNAQLDELLKNLAQNQLLQAKAMGVNSVNAENTVALANGSADIDPKVLEKIVDQADATATATKMFNQGLQKFKNRDPYNSAIHANNFQQDWQTNYDPKIFLHHVIKNQNIPDDKRREKLISNLGMPVPAEVQTNKQKQYNLLRLQQGDF